MNSNQDKKTDRAAGKQVELDVRAIMEQLGITSNSWSQINASVEGKK
ncbi:hypothetical protein ACFOLF_10720 [Paenibacillus sepulcri]|uniref:Uncharacterized protein n=1 Tax=Paenibacillus sepulcri TaxID=359917 RepID=A0ABS7BXX9_9BACL|nr:hypothetical protein [Paenibacillus sepulcri]